MKKSLLTSIMAISAALCLCVTAQAQGPVVVSDKDDYSPGETAMFTASGFQPGETLDFSIAAQDDQGLWVPDIAWADVPADASGSAEVDYVVPETWWGKTFQLSVMGLSSGLMATTTFTDGNSNVNFNTTGLPPGTSVTVNYSGTNNGGNPISGTATFSNPGPSSPSIGTKGGTPFSFTFPASIAVGVNTYDLISTSQASPFNTPDTGPPTPTTTVTGTYQLHVVAVNHPPVITCLDPTAELGAKVGCLVGGILQADFPVSYGVIAGTGNSKTVQATFTTDSGPVTVNVAGVTDVDAGDTIAVSLANGTTPVTISGPGSGSASFSVDITANDGHAPNVNSTCGGTANAQVTYVFNGFFQPLDNNSTTIVKRGSTVPVKFQVSDGCGNQITTANFSIDVSFLSGAVPAGNPEVTDAGASNDNGDLFRYDPIGMQWIYNLQTKVGYVTGDTYQISADLGDGVDHNVSISIKK